MRYYVIPPNEKLELMHQGTMGYFCLAQHYYSNETYRNFFKAQKEAGHQILLDNGMGDHALVDEDILMWCVKDLMPSEVIPPDFLFDKNSTIRGLESFVIRMQKEDLIKDVQIFGCPQGNNIKEWLECYEYMLIHWAVKTIGMSKLGIPHAWLGEAKDDQGIMESRHRCVDYLLSNNMIKKNLHFLGMGSPIEMFKYKDLNNPLFRSTDSCNSIWSAMNGLDWTEEQFTRIPTPKNYFERKMSPMEIILAEKNINWFKNLLS